MRCFRNMMQKQLLFAGLLSVLFLTAATGENPSAMKSSAAIMPQIYLGDDPALPAECNCMDNATTLENGQFSELITIEAPTGQMWTVSAVSGLFESGSLPPPEQAVPVTAGAIIPETMPGSGIYQLSAIHVDGEGFSISVSNTMETLTIGNTCYYANPQFVDLNDLYCTSGLPVSLQVDVGGVAGNGDFTIDGQPASELDPVALGEGNYLVEYTFDAGTGTPLDEADPGCTITISKMVTVEKMPNIVMNNLVSISLGPECDAVIVPDMVLEGTYPCMNEDYIVTVFDPVGNPLGNVVTGDYMGVELMVRVETINGLSMGMGSIVLFDPLAPEITCPPDIETGRITNDVQLINGTLTSADESLLASNYSCFDGIVENSSNDHYYDLLTFSVTETDIYTFELDADWGLGAAVLYMDEFTPGQSPCYRMMNMSTALAPGQGYYTSENNTIRLSSLLMPGHTYTLLTTSRQALQLGGYRWAVYTADDGEIDGYLSFEAELVLDLFCTDIFEIFNNEGSLDHLGFPDIDDNCGDDFFVFEDEIIDNGDCADAQLIRTFTVRDASGNEDECTQVVTVSKPSLEDVVLPPKTFVLLCSEPHALTDEGYPHPSATGYPFVQSAYGIHHLDPIFCNVFATYTDLPKIQICEGSYEFIRRWFLFDDCEPGNSFHYEQLISVVDNEPPVVECTISDIEGDTLVISTGPIDCTAVFDVPMPVITDDCSTFDILVEIVTEIEVPIINEFGNQIGLDTQTVVLATILDGAVNNIVTGLPVGYHRVRYTVTDDCGNTSVQECGFYVRDLIEPVAVCDDDLFVSLNGAGYGRVYAVDVDEGSNDNCAIDTLLVRRLFDFDSETCEDVTPFYTEWSEYVEFFCCEVNEQATVQLLVIDIYGNQNTCTAQIHIMDDIDPTCTPPASVNVKCKNLPLDFDPDDPTYLANLFGSATANDNCLIVTTMEELPSTVLLDDCGVGVIIRNFQAVDQYDNTSVGVCQQVITIEESLEYKIKFPKDAIAICGIPNPDTLEIFSTGCDDIAVNVEEQFFNSPGGQCYALLRTYRVFDFCEWDGVSEPYIISRDRDCDQEGGEEDLWVIRDDTGAFLDRDNNPANNNPVAGTMSPACDGTTNPAGYWKSVNSTGYWMYTQHIYVYDQTSPEIIFDPIPAVCSYDNDNCDATVQYNFTVFDECSPDNLQVQIFRDDNADGTLDGNITASAMTGAYPDFSIAADFPFGQHAYVVQISDGCGNTNEATLPFEVVDCLAPAPVCIFGFSAELGPVEPGTDADGDGDIDNGAITVTAAELLTAVSGDCTGPITFSVNYSGEQADRDQTSIVLTCDEFGVQMVEVYAWDSAYNPYAVQPDGSVGGPNYDFCETFIQVQDNMFMLCNDQQGGFVAGIITTEDNNPAEGVSVTVSGQMTENTQTSGGGYYDFPYVPMGFNYTIYPQLNTNHKNGVSTLDLILISKHILGVEPFDSPYKMIAADVNNSKSVSTLDLIQMRKLILGVLEEFPNNTSWRFIVSDYEFPDPENPWSGYIPEVINLNNFLEYEMLDLNFVAVKVGDVNGTSQLNQQGDIDTRSMNGSFSFSLADETIETGNEYHVGFKANGLEDIRGYQFTLEFDKEALELVGMEFHPESGLGEDNFSLQLKDYGMITSSWNTDEVISVSDQEAMFTLVFQAKTNANLKDLTLISSRLTQAEAYTEVIKGDGSSYHELLNVDLLFESNDQHSGFELFQNKPNPFMGQTIIEFSLPDDMKAVMTIRDITGTTIKRIEGHFPRGYNQLRINSEELAVGGVLYYTLEADRYTATKKMIMME